MTRYRWLVVMMVALGAWSARAELNNRRYFGGLLGVNAVSQSGYSTSSFAIMLDGGQRFSESFGMGVYGYFSFASTTAVGVFGEPTLWFGSSGWKVGADVGGEFGSSGRFLIGPMIGADLDLNSNLAFTVEGHFLFSLKSSDPTSIQPGLGLRYRFD